MSNKKIIIAGAGGIGRAVGLILKEMSDQTYDLYLGDISEEQANSAVKFIKESSTKAGEVHALIMPMEGLNDGLSKALEAADIVLDCLPGSQAPRMARYCIDNNCHYANLTEYVAETNEIMEMAKGAEIGLVLQTGLAPGYINILAHHLYQKFCKDNNVEKVRRIAMKVGALSDYATSPSFYAYTWSPIGVATEYVKPAVVVKDYDIMEVSSLSDTRKVIIRGKTYEDDFTSGGAADLPKALDGKVKSLDYRTLRYPGHYDWVRSILREMHGDPVELNKVMQEEIPQVWDDNVVVYVGVRGKDDKGVFRAVEQSYHIKPMKIGRAKLKAIQTTTAGPFSSNGFIPFGRSL